MDDRLNTKFSVGSLSSGDDSDSEVSEVLDIRLWFPSYESPESNVSDDFDGFDVQKEITGRKDRSEELYKSNQEKRCSKEVKEPTPNIISKELPTVGTEKEVTPARSSIQPFSGCSSIPPKKKEGLNILEKVLAEIANREISAKDPENSLKLSPSKGDVEEKTVIEEHNGSDNSFSSPKENVSPEKFIARRDCEEKSDGFISVKKKENAKARRENLSNRRTKKDPLADDPSARINKICTSVNYGNSRDGQVNNGSGCVLDGEKGEGRCGGEHNQATETAWLGRTELLDRGLPVNGGKWQCPRKNKPYQEPPLKQLRLERWVHRLHN